MWNYWNHKNRAFYFSGKERVKHLTLPVSTEKKKHADKGSTLPFSTDKIAQGSTIIKIHILFSVSSTSGIAGT